MCRKCMWIINFSGPWRKFVCVCVHERMHALLATPLYFIQVDSKFMLPAPLALESYWKKKKVKWKAAVIVMQFRYMATASHSHLGTVMQKRWCVMQTNPAETHQQKVEKWKYKIGFRALCIQTTEGSYTQNLFYAHYKQVLIKDTRMEYPSKKSVTVWCWGYFFFLWSMFSLNTDICRMKRFNI